MQINHLKALFTSLAAAIAITSFSDDKFSLGPDPGEGQATLSAEILFRNYTPALSRTSGSALNGIDNLFVIIFNESGDFVDIKKFDRNNLNISSSSQTPPDGTGVEQPVTTDKASFNIDLPYGKYRIYGACNIRGEYETRLRANCDNETALKAVAMEWNKTTIADNDQMFGVFDLGTADKLPVNTFDAQTIAINRRELNLSGWMRRLGSKVTVGYDPTGLYEGVTIYIKQVTIHDIAKECPLGESNKPTKKNELIETGGTVTYYTEGSANDRNGWLRLQKGTPGGPVFGTDHSATAEALFFYENNQGDFKDEPDREKYNKTMNPGEMADNEFLPDHTRPGGNPGYVDWKDKVPYGTYVEVEAYYVSANPERPSSGPIRYRFMLGKNTTYDYNAQRNHHFKLTLCFRGWANEPDWHIDYDEPTPGIFTPEEYFISYLYDQTMSMPVRLTNTSGVAKLRAEIIENNWAPYDPNTADGVPATSEIAGSDFAWNRSAYTFLKAKYNSSKYNGNANFLGFLSMRKTTTNMIGSESTNYGEKAMTELANYYVDNKRGWAEYDLTSIGDNNIEGNDTYGRYKVRKDGEGVIVDVPMWTRAKHMIPMTSFSGNNPYNAYRRKAVVRFTAMDAQGNQVKFKDENGGEFDYKDVPVFQVRRIENPKAIWRSSDNDEGFDIDLSILAEPGTKTFTSLTSSGAWRASIMVDNGNFITISKDGKTVSQVNNDNTDDKYITGSTGSYMRFSYKPSGKTTAGSSRSGIIKVEYQDYSCVHYIFVRQGYDGRTRLGGKDWSNYNIYAMKGTDNQPQNRNGITSMDVLTTESPLAVGSFFKRCNYRYGILESNNIDYGAYVNITNVNLNTAKISGDNNTLTKETARWNQIGAYGWSNSDATYSWVGTMRAVNQSNSNMKVPSYDDYEKLADCRQGFGVVYGDGAKNTAKTTQLAYGFRDTDNNNNGYNNSTGGSESGMRACIVYDESNGNQIIFPIGIVGQGRRARTVWDFTRRATMSGCPGMLSYSGVYGVLPNEGNYYRPIPYNLYRDPGVVYWFEIPKPKGHKPTQNNSASWDINYFSFAFGPYDSASLGGDNSNSNVSDALPIRLIYK